MADFEELTPPHQPRDGIWRVRIDYACDACYLRNNGSFTLAGWWNNPTEWFDFETEEHAHEHAKEYYKKHGRDYPYMAEWANSSVVRETVDVSVVGSEVMEFEYV